MATVGASIDDSMPTLESALLDADERARASDECAS